MADHTPVQPAPEDVKRAEEMWHNVTRMAKWHILAAIVIVAFLGAVFIDWS